MARVALKSEIVARALGPDGSSLRVRPGAKIRVYEHGTTDEVPVFAAEEGTATLAQPLIADRLGYPPGWADPQRIDVAVDGWPDVMPVVLGEATGELVGDAAGRLAGTFPAPEFADPSVEALADLTPAADKLPYFDGPDSAALGDLTALGRSVAGAANAETAQEALDIRVIHEAPINPKNAEYGAVGDGVADDTAALVAAVAAAHAASTEGEIYLPPGIYNHDEELVVTEPISIRGAGKRSSVLVPQACNGLQLGSTGTGTFSGGVAEHFQIDGSAGCTGGVIFGEAPRALLNELYVHSCAGIGIDNNGDGTLNYLRLLHVWCEGNDLDGCDLQAPGSFQQNVEVIGCRMHGNGRYGLLIGGINFKIIAGEYQENAAWGIGIAQTDSGGGLILAPTIEDNGGSVVAWSANTAVDEFDRRISTDLVTNPAVYQCTVAGTTDATTEPTWQASAPRAGDTLVDGDVTWMNVGTGGNGHGAGIDDRGASRVLYVSNDLNDGRMLGAGRTSSVTPDSRSTHGGARRYRFGGDDGPNVGYQVYGGATAVFFAARTPLADILGSDTTAPDADLSFLPQGSGKVKVTNLEAAVPTNTQTGDYTLVATDAGKVVEINSASNRTVTVPANSSVAFPVGTVIELSRIGTGTLTVAAGVGVTVNSPGGFLSVTHQYGSASLRKRATDSWVLTGDLS